MNYHHSFHAGNFADVVKHAVLTRLVEYLKRKPKPFRVLDTHAGQGLYDLQAHEATRTGEWRQGIGNLLAADLQPDAAGLLAPYLDIVGALNTKAAVTAYPGSPLIVRRMLRPQDRLSAIELHDDEAEKLKALFKGDFQTRVIRLDGWLALGAHLPPKEKRGLVLVDPPFELEGEFERLVEGAARAFRRWTGGIYALWYPVKDRRAVAAFRTALAGVGAPDILDISFEIRAPSNPPRLDGCGLAIINPPFVLEQELRIILPALLGVLGDGKGGSWKLERLGPRMTRIHDGT